jgi:hypothetical protein
VRQLPELSALEARRRVLVRESDRHRQSLVVEYRNIEMSVTRMTRIFAVGRAVLPLVTLLGALKAALFPRRRNAGRSMMSHLIVGGEAALHLASAWRVFSRGRAR